jgi:hypothetical protein
MFLKRSAMAAEMWKVQHGGCVNAATGSVLPNDDCQGSFSGLADTAEMLHVKMP